jgi:hypothetical protein
MHRLSPETGNSGMEETLPPEEQQDSGVAAVQKMNTFSFVDEYSANQRVLPAFTITVSLCRGTGGMTSNGTENAARIEFTCRVESSVLPESCIDVRPITSIAVPAPANSFQTRVSPSGGTERFHFGPAPAAACRVESKSEVEA